VLGRAWCQVPCTWSATCSNGGDPRSPARLPQAGYGLRVIVMCVEGYTSSLAAASLQDLGVAGATDLAGGFRAWQRAGLPVVPGAVEATKAAGVP
jgi:hypothetical protein